MRLLTIYYVLIIYDIISNKRRVKFANCCDMKIDDEKLLAYNNMNGYINNYLDKILI